MNELPLYIEECDYARALQTDRGIKYSDQVRRPYGSDTIKDRSRILHSPFMRRLQGKMQLFPIGESDVLRTRLTHSHEVADIAITICDRLNSQDSEYFRRHPIDRSIVAAAGLAHDIGHPPFGHDGETALNICMRNHGAGEFEGNAQTLRILSKLENRLSRHQSIDEVKDVFAKPYGLNLTFRSLAAFVKYDKCLMNSEETKSKPKLGADVPYQQNKGFYPEEKELVDQIKNMVIKGYSENTNKKLPTVECQIMDIADDIAYSTYDLEDAMVAGIVTPFDLISCQGPIAEAIKDQVNTKLADEFSYNFTTQDVTIILVNIFKEYLRFEEPGRYNLNRDMLDRSAFVAKSYQESRSIANNRILRRAVTEYMIQSAISSISVELNPENPELSRVKLDTQKMIEIECLKAFNYLCVINSQNSRMHSQRGQLIVSFVFETLVKKGTSLLPDDDYRERYNDLPRNSPEALRFVCDYVAEMTDEEALSFYRRLSTTDRMLIHNLHYPIRG